MIVDRYYYQKLNPTEQVIYRTFYRGVMAHQELIPLPIRGTLSKESFGRIFNAMTRDNPLIYFLNQSACSCARDLLGHTAICPKYFFDKEKVKEYNRKIERTVNQIIDDLNLLNCSSYEKELRIHDWFCKNISYDYEGSDRTKVVRAIASHNIWGVFAYHKAQCEGIAKAVKVLLNAADEKCIVVCGEACKNKTTIPHAWNLVNIDGHPYHLDVTWDIGAKGKEIQRIPYDYFNLSDEWIGIEHRTDTLLPEAASMDQNYFLLNGILFHHSDEVLSFVETNLQKGAIEFYIRYLGRKKMRELVQELQRKIVKFYQEQGCSDKQIRSSVNEQIKTCWIGIV